MVDQVNDADRDVEVDDDSVLATVMMRETRQALAYQCLFVIEACCNAQRCQSVEGAYEALAEAQKAVAAMTKALARMIED